MEQAGGDSESQPAAAAAPDSKKPPAAAAAPDSKKPPAAGDVHNKPAACVPTPSSNSISQANQVGATTSAPSPGSGGSGQRDDMTGTTKRAWSTSTSESTIANNAATSEEKAFIDGLIDDVIFCECLQVHRAAKMGFIFTEPGDELYKIRDGNGLDVFGQPLARPKKQLNCTCPQCGRNIGASRLAPHLEKCMGMGRLSSRAAASNKRDASS